MYSTIRLCTKFLLSLLSMTAGLTAATLYVVRYGVEMRVRESFRGELHSSVKSYETFARERESSLVRSAQMLANLPNVRALMTTEDAVTIQDQSASIWRVSGGDLLVLANRSGEIAGLQTSDTDFGRAQAQESLRATIQNGESRNWWVVATTLPGMADSRSTLPASLPVAIEGDLPGEFDYRNARYLGTTVNPSTAGQTPVTLTVLKSLDQETIFLSRLNRILLGLGLLSVLAGGMSVFLPSHTFTRPLENLVAGVQALEKGNFEFPLELGSKDEVGEVTGAFDRMNARRICSTFRCGYRVWDESGDKSAHFRTILYDQGGKGTGLGLATVYGIIKQSGGFIWVESALGKGTTFEICLPQSTKAVLLPDEIHKGKPLAGRNETILVAEDEPGVLKLASEFLKAGGYNILEASEGAEALRIVNSHSATIDIVLSDMVMPGMSGSELAETLKRIRPGTRVIHMNGYAEFSGKNEERPPGVTRVLQKPFSRNTLLEKVREAMCTAPFSPQDGTKMGGPA